MNFLSLVVALEMTPLELAIWEVESGQFPGGTPFFGDNGAAAGPMQVHKNYWIDSGVGGKYPDSLFDLGHSVKCFRGYMDRYAIPSRIPSGSKMCENEIKARLHNGGPQALKATGKKKKNLDRYWEKVKKVLKELQK